MMRYPCSACGGRGPHAGDGHAYTTDPDFIPAEIDRRIRIAEVIGIAAADFPERRKLAIALSVASASDPGPEYWAERDGDSTAATSEEREPTVEIPTEVAQQLRDRALSLTDRLRREPSEGFSSIFTEKTLDEVRTVITVLNLTLSVALGET